MWHGPALGDLLAGVTPEQAAARPIEEAHSIWEITLHTIAWAEIARARMRGERMDDPTAEEDWPPVRATSAEAWAAVVERVRQSHRELAADIRHLSGEQMQEKIGTLDYSVSNLLHGVIEHSTYHGGQIALLKKALGAGSKS